MHDPDRDRPAPTALRDEPFRGVPSVVHEAMQLGSRNDSARLFQRELEQQVLTVRGPERLGRWVHA